MTTQQPREKPYDFVPLASESVNRPAAGHHTVCGNKTRKLLSGILTGTMISESLIHIGSGFIMPIGEILAYSDLLSSSVQADRIVASHMRSAGKRVIPGSTIKGMIRSAVEAITTTGMQFEVKPRTKTVRGVSVTKLENKVHTQKLQPPPGPPSLALSSRLFGLTDRRYGYQAHCAFEDAPQIAGEGLVFRMLPLYRPQPDYSEGEPEITTNWHRYFMDADCQEVRGRKFYRSGSAKEVRPPYTAVEACGVGSRFPLHMRFSNLSPAELGVVLIVLGASGDIPHLIVGSGKPIGFGSLKLIDLAIQVLDAKSYTEFEVSYQSYPIADAVQAAEQSGEIFDAGRRKFAEIMSMPSGYTAGGDERLY